MDRPIRIVVADDHALFRQCLRRMIDAQAGLQTVAEAEDGVTAIKMAHQYKPDLLLMDIRMPGMDGIQATEMIKSEFPDMKIIALSSFSDTPFREMMLAAGASAYLNKICSRSDLLTCIDQVCARRRPPLGE